MRTTEKNYCLYAGFCLAILPVILMRDFTPANELRYLSIADEALRNHTFFTFYSHGALYADKPPFYFWLVMLLRSILGSHQMWALSLLSVVPTLVSVRTLDKWVAQEIDTEHRLIAQMILLTCGIFLGAALTIRMDMLMCMFIILAMRSFWTIYTQADGYRRARWLFPVYLFLALFTKGPLGILIPLCSTLVFLATKKQAKCFFSIWGWRTWSILILGCALWWGMVYVEGGSEYLNNLLFHQTVDRAVHAFHHHHPFYFYMVCIWYCIAPWTIHIVASIVMSLQKKAVRSPLHTFFITSSITTLVLLSCISSKLEIYMIPAIPFLVYATALYLPRVSQPRWLRFCRESTVRYVAAVILTIIFIGGLTMPFIDKYIGYRELSNMAQRWSAETGIKNYATWKVSHAEDMDIYLRQPVHVIEGEEHPLLSAQQACILMIPIQYQDFFRGCKSQAVGDYTVIVFDPQNTSKIYK